MARSRRRQITVLVVMSIASIVAMTVGCVSSGGSSSGGATSLTGTDWRLTELNGAPALPGHGPREPRIRLTADSARLTGNTGCNTMGGGFESSGDRLRFSKVFTTRMACVDTAPSRQESDFVKMIDSVDRYKIDGEVLTLYAGDRAVARFTAAQPK